MDSQLLTSTNIRQYPIPDSKRVCTDVVCTAIGLTFTAALLITSLFIFNQDHFTKSAFPSDSAGRVCGHDLTSHPYIYFTHFPSIDQRLCVSACPTQNQTALDCVPTPDIGCRFNSNPQFYVGYYPNTAQSTKIGSFCAPNDAILKDKLYDDIGITNRYNFFKDVQIMVVCGLVALGLSLVFLVLVQCLPSQMNTASILLGITVMVALIVFVAAYPSGNINARIIFGLILLLLFATTAYGSWKMRASFGFYSIFLNQSTLMLKQNWLLLTYIPIFFIVLVLFVLLMMLQTRGFWSSVPVQFTPSQLYYSLSTSSLAGWSAVLALQFIWGLSFIKQSFNYCVSANAVRWYFDQVDNNAMKNHTVFTPLKLLLTKNFGSVVGGSFMNGFFSLFDLIFDLLRPDSTSNCECYKTFYRSVFSCIGDFFNLVRADAFAYIALTGNPYCNSSRYCELIYHKAFWFKDSQSISRSYRICSHLLLAGITGLVNLLLQGKDASLFIVLTVFLFSLFISTLWISLHADATDAMQVTFLLDQNFTGAKDSLVFQEMSLKTPLVKLVEEHCRSLQAELQH